MQVIVRGATATFKDALADEATNAALKKSTVTFLLKGYLKALGYTDDLAYETHISIHPGIQGKGYAAKMLTAVALKLNHPLWLAKARIVNQHMFSVIEKLKHVPVLDVQPLEYNGAVQGWLIRKS